MFENSFPPTPPVRTGPVLNTLPQGVWIDSKPHPVQMSQWTRLIVAWEKGCVTGANGRSSWTLERRVSLVVCLVGFSLAVVPSGCRGAASVLAAATSVRLMSRGYVRLLIWGPPSEKFAIQSSQAHQTGQTLEPLCCGSLWSCNRTLGGLDTGGGADQATS